MLLERVGDEEQAILEPEGAGVAHEADLKMSRILDRRQAVREDAPGPPIDGGGSAIGKGLMRAVLVVLRAEAIERDLLTMA